MQVANKLKIDNAAHETYSSNPNIAMSNVSRVCALKFGFSDLELLTLEVGLLVSLRLAEFSIRINVKL